jgi:hypothetical protein
VRVRLYHILITDCDCCLVRLTHLLHYSLISQPSLHIYKQINNNNKRRHVGTPTNDTCNVNCDQGYHQDSSGPATCYAGVWTTKPTCEEDPCPAAPSTIANMNSTASSSCAHTYSQSTCDIVCDEGYTAANSTMTCIRGEWMGNAICVPNPCDNVPPIEHIDSVASASCLNTESGASCNITCLDGYTVEDTASATCYNGMWVSSNPPLPSCVADCSTHPPVDHINASATDCGDSSHLTTCDFVCDSGFTPTGSSTCNNGT